RIAGVADERQYGDEQQADRLAEVDQAPDGVVGEDLLRFAQVAVDDRGVVVAGQDGLAVRDRDRVDLDVGNPGTRIGLMGDLVHVALGRNAGADVEELADAARGEEPHRPAEEIAVGPRDRPDVGIDRGDRPAQVLVGQEIVAAAQQVVVDTGGVRPLGVHSRRYPARLVSPRASPPGVCDPAAVLCAAPGPTPGQRSFVRGARPSRGHNATHFVMARYLTVLIAGTGGLPDQPPGRQCPPACGGTSSVGLRPKKPVGLRVNPHRLTGITGQSSGRGKWVGPNVCHSTTSAPSMSWSPAMKAGMPAPPGFWFTKSPAG